MRCSLHEWRKYAICTCKNRNIVEEVIFYLIQKDYIVYKCITETLINEDTCRINIKTKFSHDERALIFECFLNDPNMDYRLWSHFVPIIKDLSKYSPYIVKTNRKNIIYIKIVMIILGNYSAIGHV